MKKQVSLIVILIALILTACNPLNVAQTTVDGSGKVTTESRQVSGISGVSLATLGDLTVELGDQESLRIEAEDNLIPYLETEVRNNQLTIQARLGLSLRPTRPVRYFLTVKSLDSVSVSSSGNITAPSLQAGNFSAKISSSGDIKLAGIQADSLNVQISSSGNLEMGSGQVGNQTVVISSSGNYQAGDLKSQTADVRISSSGNATVWVADNLAVHLSSSGNVSYYGSPKVTQEASSSGKSVALGNK